MKRSWPLQLLGLAALLGCAARPASPEQTARAFGRACVQGDHKAMRALLSEPEALDAPLADELKARCAALAGEPLRAAIDTVYMPQNTSVSVRSEDGVHRIAAADALPGGGLSPEAALAALRGQIERWLRQGTSPWSLASATRSERLLLELHAGLRAPHRLLIDLQGDQAEVEVPPGHRIQLLREGGLWRVEAFE